MNPRWRSVNHHANAHGSANLGSPNFQGWPRQPGAMAYIFLIFCRESCMGMFQKIISQFKALDISETLGFIKPAENF